LGKRKGRRRVEEEVEVLRDSEGGRERENEKIIIIIIIGL
jgi:hypothetical protein